MRAGWLIALSLGLLLATHAYAQEEEDEEMPPDEGEMGAEGDEPPMDEGESDEPPPEDMEEGEGEGPTDDSEVMKETQLTAEQLRRLHDKFDHNGDGKVSLEEVLVFSRAASRSMATSGSTDLLEGMDTSKDGNLSLEEHVAFMHNEGDEAGDEETQKSMAQSLELEKLKFKAADQNGDGLIDQSELPALFYPEAHDHVMKVVIKQSFEQRDKDGDGLLTQHEFWNEPDDAADMSTEEEQDFKRLDKSGDGKLDIHEFGPWESGHFHTEESLQNIFTIADKDGDKHMTADEFAAATEELSSSDAHHHLLEWIEHHEL